jgi:hypothetical protein
MKITHYSFGKITINGKTYSSDVIIFPDHINASWWRQEGHVLNIADLKDIIREGLPLLIVGSGFYGAMKVPQETLDYLKSNKIEVFVENTQGAVKRYNDIASQKQCIAALHLTC